ncbi:biotin-independent malonate decarboxylase subunit gamma [Rhizobium sp. 768_B6_N1_8]|uniref:biotin-independent malonate decarboxylase subunit gamma n=1 Tax=unclassified Rhizobium TaxID=2613769 RepID=UPI003F227BBC
MQLADILASLFPHGHSIKTDHGLLYGSALLSDGQQALVVGVSDRAAVGVDQASLLSRHILDDHSGTGPILVIVNSDSQMMSKRDELLGLNEFLAHLAKCLIFADFHGRPTIGILYGHTAAGAFLATALATRVLVALPGAEPAVMDLASMSKVTKLSIEVLQEKAKTTAIFAPGLDNLAKTGAVHFVWNERESLASQLSALLADLPDTVDKRDLLGFERHGRTKAAEIAERVYAIARAS